MNTPAENSYDLQNTDSSGPVEHAPSDQIHYNKHTDPALDPDSLEDFVNADITAILQRIPKTWGREIRCAKGWYPLIGALDKELSALCPDYELHQVKEKFGTLRYYFDVPQVQAQCCLDNDKENPRPVSREDATINEKKLIDIWLATKTAHRISANCIEANRALESERKRRENLYETMQKVVDRYEDLSARTCELTGKPGVLMRNGGWLKTLSIEHAPEEYIPVPTISSDGATGPT